MFDTFSMRARQVVFAARFKAGKRGADHIGIDDFLLGLILEDQNMMGSLLGVHGGEIIVRASSRQPHSQFLAPDKADELLTRIGNLRSHSNPVSLSTDIPLSSDLKRVFDEADNVRKTFHHNRIGPLHLLLIILREKPTGGVELLQKAGITEEQVVQLLRTATEDS